MEYGVHYILTDQSRDEVLEYSPELEDLTDTALDFLTEENDDEVYIYKLVRVVKKPQSLYIDID